MKRFHCLILLAVHAVTAWAEPITLDFRFESVQSNAVASGYITFEQDLLPNPQKDTLVINFPSSIVLDISVHVTGTESSDGQYGMSDFTGIIWNTNGGQLDFRRELVGQTVSDFPWGTPVGGPIGPRQSGDFNFLHTNPKAPHGKDFFTLEVPESQIDMKLVSFQARLKHRLPSAESVSLTLLVILMLASLVWLDQKRQPLLA